MAAQLYMLMYFIMFLAGIRLRFKYPQHRGPFRVPGGMLGMMLVSAIGLIGVIATLVVSFIPPQTIHVGSVLRYELTLIIGLIVMCLPPVFSVWWMKRNKALTPFA